MTASNRRKRSRAALALKGAKASPRETQEKVIDATLETGDKPKVEERAATLLCARCARPAFFCLPRSAPGAEDAGSYRVQACEGEPSFPTGAAGRWLTAVRLVQLGVRLTPCPAGAYGGVLLRAAFALVQGVSRPAGISADAWRWCSTDAMSRFAPDVVLALDMLGASTQARRGLCRQIDEHYKRTEPTALEPFVQIANAAALASPWERQAWSFLAIYCDGCAGRGAIGGWQDFRDVDTFDEAVRCAGCKRRTIPSPFGWKAPMPHPVTRCLGGAWGDASRCVAHDGMPLTGGPPLCQEGRQLLEHAITDLGIRRAPDVEVPPLDPEVHDRLMTALSRHHLLLVDDRDNWRTLLENDGRGLFAAMAAHDPKMKQGLEKMLGRRIDTNAAKPMVLAAMTLDQAGVAGLLRRIMTTQQDYKALPPRARKGKRT
jgi:hypothetical protein